MLGNDEALVNLNDVAIAINQEGGRKVEVAMTVEQLTIKNVIDSGNIVRSAQNRKGKLAGEGKTKADLGRVAFVERTTAFVEETGGEILRQLRAIGCSAGP